MPNRPAGISDPNENVGDYTTTRMDKHMSQKVQAVIVRAKDAPVETVTILIPDPGPGEAVVDILTCGVCHTDLHYKLGGIGNDYPYLLGHEATGVVSKIGEGVANVAVGDRVILNWRAVCGQCRACAKGTPSTASTPPTPPRR